MTYENLVGDAVQTPFEGWDFGVLQGRFIEGKPPWDFRELVRTKLQSAASVLDLGTGGGEFLSSLGPLPPTTMATEGFAPNVPIARQRLEPLGVQVADTTADPEHLPYADDTFDLIVSRHEAYTPGEIRRVLKATGLFITQQVGGQDFEELNLALQAPPHGYRSWDLDAAANELEQSGFAIVDRREAMTPSTFHDVGAIVFHLRITPWHIPDFDLDTYDAALRGLHNQMAGGMPFQVNSHRFMLTARPI